MSLHDIEDQVRQLLSLIRGVEPADNTKIRDTEINSFLNLAEETFGFRPSLAPDTSLKIAAQKIHQDLLGRSQEL
ncbi:hypothetical protein C4546_03365 [Candidatus Parcubacteria bacterium]|jgi:hypothetical protein|nr:MAG: hypothetical protein C4546_03365 [Candidatus Parcubacteria bacterium]